MRSTVQALCVRIPLDPHSRRALDEAFADWAYEAGAATTRMGRMFASLRSLAAVARTLVLTVAEEITRIPAGPVAARLLLVLLAPVVVLTVAGWGHVSWRGEVTWAQRIALAVYCIPQASLAVLPLALFLTTLAQSRRRSFPALGLATAALVATLLAAAWMLPAGSKAFHETVNAIHSSSGPVTASGAPPDIGPLNLVRNAAARPMGPAMGVLLFRLGLSLLAAVCVILGCTAGRLPAPKRRMFTALVIACYTAALLLLPSSWELGGHAPAFVGLLPWCAAALALGLAFTLGNTRPAEGVEP